MARKHKSAHQDVEELVADSEPIEEAPAPELSVAGDDRLALDGADEGAEDLDGEDSLTFSTGVIEKIVAIAARDVEGVLGMRGGWVNRVQDAFGMRDARKGVSVEVTPENAVRVYLSVIVEYGAYAPKIFEDVKRVVVQHISGMTGLEVAGVNLRIEDVMTAEEYKAARAARRQDAEKEARKEEPAAPEAASEEAPQA